MDYVGLVSDNYVHIVCSKRSSLSSFYSLKNEKPSAIYRLKGLTQQNGGQAMPSTAAIGISIEANANVDAQMANKNPTGPSAAAEMDGMQTESSTSIGSGGALVKFGQIDEHTQTQLALAMAPKIGK